MQTFLPYASMTKSADSLDDRRLGKQRVEALQVLRALTWSGYGWQHHPAVKMWRGFEPAVATYGITICSAWVRRGRADTCAATIAVDLQTAGFGSPLKEHELADTQLPRWWGDRRLHCSHQSALVRKDPDFYGPKFPDADPNLPYW
ncbi:MAG: MSMEG_6728 family protein [Actinomycetes bacterium]